VEKYDPISDCWLKMASLQLARRGCGVAVFHGKIWAVGGHDGMHSLCDVEIYDPVQNTWSKGPSLTSCRANVGVSVVGDRIYAVGGFTGKTFLNTVEFLDMATYEWNTFVSRGSLSTEDIRDTVAVNGQTKDGSVSGGGVSNGYHSHHSMGKASVQEKNEPLVEVEEEGSSVGH